MMASTKIISVHIVIPLFFLFASTQCEVKSLNVSTLCIKEERMALLNVKKDLNDPYNCLSSWVGKDCCRWIGIECDYQTGYILKLDLGSANICTDALSFISGMVLPHLGNLSNLHYLDISNSFSSLWVRDLSWLSTLSSLQYLGMDFAKFINSPHELFRSVNKMSSMLELHLSSCCSPFIFTVFKYDITFCP
ncbi:putative leucine-rich repeat-containing, plant-type, leucine-rich repeat domain, L [Medicago truncatula]|uniref:Putative leucine-rich repeat-containing, plant-type, leucine-rich repeat domain, L n=1 Tax=Medicago truncatula TaxID=3880 RepID=A0A396J6I7_MEDTR|nr:receptor-like protein EIX2 isoform X2 [Medicago truncatula]RHN72171.1 putative leucine-rich repeat-containing, plant-type, leucine-rich repeat domain, L [Medicago truncatula]